MNKQEAIESYKDKIVGYLPLHDNREIVLHTLPNEDNDYHILIMIFDPSYYDHVNPVYFLKPSKAGTFHYLGQKYNLSDFKTDTENSLAVQRSNQIMHDHAHVTMPKGFILKWL